VSAVPSRWVASLTAMPGWPHRAPWPADRRRGLAIA